MLQQAGTMEALTRNGNILRRKAISLLNSILHHKHISKESRDTRDSCENCYNVQFQSSATYAEQEKHKELYQLWHDRDRLKDWECYKIRFICACACVNFNCNEIH